jgi:hypothetical protein
MLTKGPTAPPETLRHSYRTQAVIDWIELTITTQQGTQFQWVQAALSRILTSPGTASRSYVRPISPGAGGVAKRFAIRLYDLHANSYDDLIRIMSALEKDGFPFAAPPEISALEIALDFFSRRGDTTDLLNLTHRLQTTIAPPGNPFQANSSARQFDPVIRRNRFLNGLQKIDPNLNLRIGNKGDPIAWQLYFKRTDNNRQAIIPSAYRARAEFTISGTELAKYLLDDCGNKNIVRLADFQSFRFERLTALLHFRRLKSIDEITAGKSEYFRYAIVQAGERARESLVLYPFGNLAYRLDARTGKPRNRGLPMLLKYNRHSIADQELNRLVRDNLTRLSSRFSAQKRHDFF